MTDFHRFCFGMLMGFAICAFGHGDNLADIKAAIIFGAMFVVAPTLFGHVERPHRATPPTTKPS